MKWEIFRSSGDPLYVYGDDTDSPWSVLANVLRILGYPAEIASEFRLDLQGSDAIFAVKAHDLEAEVTQIRVRLIRD